MRREREGVAQVPHDNPAPAGAVWTARGPRAVEALLFEQVAAHTDAARRDPTQLAHPLRIVVSSRSLADHVGERLVARTGRSLAGVRIQSLYELALEILERSGASGGSSESLFPVYVRRFAADEPLLRERLGALVDGYACVEATVSDLLDAGFDAASADAFDDALAAADASEAVRATAAAVARTARRCLAAFDAGALGHRSRLLRAASEALARDAEVALPSRAVFVHGFADATGVRAELIEGLVRERGATVLIDEPPDPLAPDEPDAGRRFAQRLLERLRLVARERASPRAAETAALEFVECARPEAEVREVAARVRQALDREPIAPERIAVVARDLAGYRAALASGLRRLGIPFSGARDATAGPLVRRARALERLLADAEDCRADDWLDARAQSAIAAAASDLRLGLHRLGLLRLGDVAGRPADAPGVKLPVVGGWWSDAADGGERRVPRRRLSTLALARASEQARAVVARLAGLRRAADAAEQLVQLATLARVELAWDTGPEALRERLDEFEALAPELAGQPALTLGELALLVRRRLVPELTDGFGGRGGGVQVLDVTQARGRSFERLFVLGLLRDGFPRNVREDPLLPDRVREGVRAVLPDVPVKSLGHDEERHLFASLTAAAPRVTLLWPRADANGRLCARSSFIERLAWGGAFAEPWRPPAIVALGAPAPDAAAVLTLEEHALRAALAGPASRLAAVLPRVLPGIVSGLLAGASRVDAERLAAVRLAILHESRAEAPGAEPRLGPYFGFVGRARSARDPRTAPLYVTTLEGLARCPWQTFLERLLRLEAPPDATGALPGIDARLLGTAVHRALATLFAAQAPADAAGARPLAWPGDEALAVLAQRAASDVLADEGVPFRGLARVLALRALPFLLGARTLDARDPTPPSVIAVEQEREIRAEDAHGRARALRFRADRVERVGERERLTDFKTGRPLSEKKKPETRHADFVAAVAGGRTLQPVAYALSTPDGGSGRLLYLGPDLAPGGESFEAARSDAELAQGFARALHGLFAAWDEGSFFPRLLEPDLEQEPKACGYCAVAQACQRGDTGSRRRLAAWLEAQGRAPADPAHDALLALFQLGAGSAAEGGEAS